MLHRLESLDSGCHGQSAPPSRGRAHPQYMLCTGAQTIQYFVPTLVGARKWLYVCEATTDTSVGWKGYVGQYHTIPLYACAFVFILTFCFAVSMSIAQRDCADSFRPIAHRKKPSSFPSLRSSALSSSYVVRCLPSRLLIHRSLSPSRKTTWFNTSLSSSRSAACTPCRRLL